MQEYWFQRFSCALQRNLVAFYKLSVALLWGDSRFVMILKEISPCYNNLNKLIGEGWIYDNEPS